MNRLPLLALAATLIASAAAPLPAAAQTGDWPKAKPITYVVPFTAGGSTDVVGRTVTEKLQAALGQSIVVENKPGQAGGIGASFVAKAAQVYLGDAGLYLTGALAGLTDIDPIALSMAQLAQAQPASQGVAARTIVIAVLSNTAVKGAMAIFMGAPALRGVMLPSTLAILAVGALAALLL